VETNEAAPVQNNITATEVPVEKIGQTEEVSKIISQAFQSGN